jgi:hypothetical protein
MSDLEIFLKSASMRKDNTDKTIKIIVTDVHNKEIDVEGKTTNNQNQSPSHMNQENSNDKITQQIDLNDDHLEKKLLDVKKIFKN